mmetsp:Transcript_6098/g.9244  ORF Transcript_6098/g.9244 Transcript_6098/m.9244 type:complete len:398 (+) Transcript_6098:119-1312(+)
MEDSDKKPGSQIETAEIRAGGDDVLDEQEGGASSSINKWLQPHDFEKIAVVQNATKGKAVVVSGGGYTAEAWEMDRKMRTLQQLQMARKFRAIMEQALEDAKNSGSKKEAMAIFDSHKKIILEMAALTDAIRGGYTLDSYDEYTKNERSFQAQRSHRTAQSIFCDVRKRIAWENSSELLVKEKRAVELERQSILETETIKLKKKDCKLEKNRSTQEKNASKPEKNANKKRKTADPTVNTKQAPPNVAAKSSPSKKVKVDTPSSNPTVQNKRTSPSKSQAKVATPKVATPNVAPKPKPPQKTTTKRPSTRKCHYCKETKADFIACTYWHTNGKQCKKSFCLSCIAQNPVFNRSSPEKEFQCPSCLGTCDCNSCINIRGREHDAQVERSSKRLSRDAHD